jgi:hypothetical protein
MSVDLVCPECGGIIGASGADGKQPCICFRNGTSKSDTVAIESPVRDLNSSQKICISCGRDVTGHRRVKDSRGYMCYNCAKAEQEMDKVGTLPCAECGRRVRPDALLAYGNIKICKRCFNDHKEKKKKSVKKIATRHYELHEKRTLIWLSVAFGILLCLVIYSFYRWKTKYQNAAATHQVSPPAVMHSPGHPAHRSHRPITRLAEAVA